MHPLRKLQPRIYETRLSYYLLDFKLNTFIALNVPAVFCGKLLNCFNRYQRLGQGFELDVYMCMLLFF